MIPSIIFCCIVYWLVGLNPDRFGEFVGISMLTTLVAISLGLAVSAFAPSVEAASAIGPPLMVIGILFGGFYIDIASLPIVANWIPYFSFIRWAFEAYCINEYKGLKFNCHGAAKGACRMTGEEVLYGLSFDGHTTSYPVFGLGMVWLGFLAVAYTILHNSKAKYTPLGWKGGKYDGLEAKSAGSSSTIKDGGKVHQSAVAISAAETDVSPAIELSTAAAGKQ